MRKPLVKPRNTLRLRERNTFVRGGEFSMGRRKVPQAFVPVIGVKKYNIRHAVDVMDCHHLVDANETFWELALFGRAQVHPHPPLSVPLQRISPPLARGSALASAHPTYASPLELCLCDAIFIDHSTQRRCRGESSCSSLAAVSGGFLLIENPITRPWRYARTQLHFSLRPKTTGMIK